jgi:ABC-2 type transport system permease protein
VIAALSSEWLKIRTTRTIFWLLAALTALITLITVSSVLSAEKSELVGADDQLGLLGIGVLAPIIALVMGIVVSTGEFRHGTITPTLLATPSRVRVVLSKGVAAVVLGVSLVAYVEALIVAEMAAFLPIRGIDLALESGDVVRFLARVFVVAGVWGALGSGLGLAFRNQIGTVVGCLAWIFPIEPIIHTILQSHVINSYAGRFLPLASTFSVLNNNSDNSEGHMLGHAGGIAMLCIWVSVATILALLLLKRRDVN